MRSHLLNIKMISALLNMQHEPVNRAADHLSFIFTDHLLRMISSVTS